MKPALRMLAMERMRQNEPPYRSEYGGNNPRRMIGYDRDNTERPRNTMPEHGWEHPPMNTYDGYPGMPHIRPQSEMYGGGYPMEARRRRDRRGRYAMGGMEYDDDDDDDRRGKTDWSDTRMYAAGVAWAEPSDKHSKHPEHYAKEVDQATAMEWVQRMKNADGTTGPHYKPEQAEQLRSVHCPHCKRWEFFTALNMMYSDYSDVAKKMGVDKPEFYTCMAKAFLDDEDAGEHKLAKYMEEIPK